MLKYRQWVYNPYPSVCLNLNIRSQFTNAIECTRYAFVADAVRAMRHSSVTVDAVHQLMDGGCIYNLQNTICCTRTRAFANNYGQLRLTIDDTVGDPRIVTHDSAV